MTARVPKLPTLDELEGALTSDWVNDGTITYCRHCGIEKDATTAKFFVDHYKECVEPRRRE